eukprot:5935338-Ditylum_brightwellii.AAC.1
MNDHLDQFLPRDDETPQVKLVENELMDILENAVPKSWQGKCIDRDSIVQSKDRPNSSDSANAWSCWIHQSKPRRVDRMPHEQLATGSESSKKERPRDQCTWVD